jgi:hypothetical protein
MAGSVAQEVEVLELYIEAAGKPGLAPLETPTPSDPLKLATSLARIIETTRRVLLCNHAAGVGLAVRLYWNDHGRYPGSLAELVPEYLPAVPLDPMAKGEGRRPLGYLIAENGRRPVVWSVGENGTPDTTEKTVLPRSGNYGWRSVRNGEVDDQWIDLGEWHE